MNYALLPGPWLCISQEITHIISKILKATGQEGGEQQGNNRLQNQTLP